MPRKVRTPSSSAKRSPTMDFKDLDDDNNNNNNNNDTADNYNNYNDDDSSSYLHLTTGNIKPLFLHHTPSAPLQSAYDAQFASRAQYDSASKERNQYEKDVWWEKMGRLDNLMRESMEREESVRRVLREKTCVVYELELSEGAEKEEEEFNLYIGRIKSGGGQLPSGESSGGDETEETKLLAEWIQAQQQSYKDGTSTLAPHQLATLESVGVTLPLSTHDKWHRGLVQFQQYRKEYYNNEQEDTLDEEEDVMASIASSNGSSSSSSSGVTTMAELQKWCTEQQTTYQTNGFQHDLDKYNKLVNAGFQFDVVVREEEWEEYVDELIKFKSRFGSVHVPTNDGHQTTTTTTSSNIDNSSLKEFVSKTRKVVQRHALSRKRMKHLKDVELYNDLGGKVYEYHAKFCREGRVARGEDLRVLKKKKKKKRPGKEIMGVGGGVKVVVQRGGIEKWGQKLNKIIAYKNKHGHIDITNNVKLRGWIYSTIRKLSRNRIPVAKLALIEKEEGLKEFLLSEDNLSAAREDGASLGLKGYANGGGDDGGDDAEEYKDSMEELEPAAEEMDL
eukprot:scaffold13320_cov215-Alexandrium_tamarense.AAC.13